VQDLGNGRAGRVSHAFEVPDSSFRTSTPVLSDTLEAGAASSGGVPLLGARRSFAEQSTLYFQFDVYGAAIDPAKGEPRVSSSYSVRDRAGLEWAQSGPAWMRAATGGIPARTGEISLTFKPGDYDLVINVKDEVTGQTLEVIEPPPFTVASAAPEREPCPPLSTEAEAGGAEGLATVCGAGAEGAVEAAGEGASRPTEPATTAAGWRGRAGLSFLTSAAGALGEATGAGNACRGSSPAAASPVPHDLLSRHRCIGRAVMVA
jgi:hypothetical protein